RKVVEPLPHKRLGGEFPAEVFVSWARDLPVVKFWKFLRVMKEADGLAAEFAPFFRWATVCSVGWAAVWVLVVKSIGDDTQRVSLVPAFHDVLHATYPFLDLGAVLRHYAPLPHGWPPGWEAIPLDLVALSFGLTATRYYLEIFSMLSLRHVRGTI